MGHIAHIVGAIFMYAILIGAFIAALIWRVRTRLRAGVYESPEITTQVLLGDERLDSSNAH